MTYNNELKVIDTQEKSYLLGLFYSDGYVGENYPHVGITLHKKDSYIFNELLEHFPFFYTDVDKSKENTIELRSSIKDINIHLKENGVLPNKSSKNKENIRFPNIDGTLKNHFIRGFFDGDGSVYFSKTNSINSKYCTFCGNCFNFLSDLQSVLEENGIHFRKNKYNPSKYSDPIIKGKEIDSFKDIMYLTISSRKDIEMFSEYLYNNSRIYFARKRKTMDQWYRTLSEREECQICDGKNTVFSGSNRIYCKDCNRYVPINTDPMIKMESKQCKHCGSFNTVGNGKTRSRKDNAVISQIFLCKDCERNSSYKI